MKQRALITLADLPAFHVDAIEIEEADTETRLTGTFTHLTGVREGSGCLYAGKDLSLFGELEDLDATARTATFVAPFWSRESPMRAGSLLPWLDGYWRPYQVAMIISPEAVWRRTEFSAVDAQHFDQGNAHGWSKVGHELPEGATATHVATGGWDHEHCELCSKHIGAGGDRFGYVDQDDLWLCSKCYRRHAEPRDLGFLLDT